MAIAYYVREVDYYRAFIYGNLKLTASFKGELLI
jgi:hypothetical protein